MSTELTSVLPYVLPQVPGCPQPLAMQAINSTLIDFCQQTLILQTLTTQTVTAAVQEYKVLVPPNTKLVKVVGAWYADSRLTPIAVEDVPSGVALRGSVTVGSQVASPIAGTPNCFFQKSPMEATVQLYPVPDTTVAGGLLLRVAIRPTRTATTVDDEIFNEWVEVISAGALSRLLNMPSQPFYAPAAAAISARDFDVGCLAARNKARKGSVAVTQTVKLRPFA